MVEWFKVLGGIKEPLLMVLAMVVLVVLVLSFRLVQAVIDMVVSKTTDHTVTAIKALAEELKVLSKDTTRIAICVDDMKRHQEICNNRPRKTSAADGDNG
jgi:hypothetical protein